MLEFEQSENASNIFGEDIAELEECCMLISNAYWCNIICSETILSFKRGKLLIPNICEMYLRPLKRPFTLVVILAEPGNLAAPARLLRLLKYCFCAWKKEKNKDIHQQSWQKKILKLFPNLNILCIPIRIHRNKEESPRHLKSLRIEINYLTSIYISKNRL